MKRVIIIKFCLGIMALYILFKKRYKFSVLYFDICINISTKGRALSLFMDL